MPVIARHYPLTPSGKVQTANINTAKQTKQTTKYTKQAQHQQNKRDKYPAKTKTKPNTPGMNETGLDKTKISLS